VSPKSPRAAPTAHSISWGDAPGHESWKPARGHLPGRCGPVRTIVFGHGGDRPSYVGTKSNGIGAVRKAGIPSSPGQFMRRKSVRQSLKFLLSLFFASDDDWMIKARVKEDRGAGRARLQTGPDTRAVNSLKDAGVLLAVMAVLACVYSLLPLRAALEFGEDEGYELMKGFLCNKGFALYKDIWSDQPPVFSLLLSAVFGAWGPTVLAARLLAAGFGLGLAAAFCFLVSRRFGYWCAVLAAFFLAASAKGLGQIDAGRKGLDRKIWRQKDERRNRGRGGEGGRGG